MILARFTYDGGHFSHRYPLAELVFRSARAEPPAEEFCSFAGSLINVPHGGHFQLVARRGGPTRSARWTQSFGEVDFTKAGRGGLTAAGAFFSAQVLAFAAWTVGYTLPRWDSLVLQPIAGSKYSQDVAEI
jgi:hypothetical protein